MISCISPDIGNVDQTLNTLRYADRVKERNAETGALPSSCREPTKMWASLQPLRLSSQEESSSFDSQGTDPSPQPDYIVAPDYEDDDFALPSPSLINGPPTTEKQKAAKRLIEEHQAVMTKWLEMSHEEMELARYADGDNPNMVEYTARLEAILSQHRDWVSELREVRRASSAPLDDSRLCSGLSRTSSSCCVGIFGFPVASSVCKCRGGSCCITSSKCPSLKRQ